MYLEERIEALELKVESLEILLSQLKRSTQEEALDEDRGQKMYRRYSSLRDKSGYTDGKVCKLTGIASATMTSWKHGTYTPKVEKISKIAELFNVPLEYLLGETT